jgi:hypothetical protein
MHEAFYLAWSRHPIVVLSATPLLFRLIALL